MTKNKIHGFEFIRDTEISEISGTVREARHLKSGARLLFIDREDTNKTFAIAFKTVPEDDTGVFHILEHSVLCGSRKYPVKEPFVELLKGSLKTFLNAMTYNDKTVYPVSSRNGKDFLNLVSVYMDAVLHPQAVKDERIFMQEGWHYELNSPEDEMIYKGVVFNEMKGAYSSADEVEFEEMATLLYKGSCYAKDSGGNPLAIPSLTYEKFKEAHERFYHPSNSMIMLDGSVDLDATLALLDSFLSEYDIAEPVEDIPRLKPAGHSEKTVKYEISETEDAEGKARLCLGYMAGDFSDKKTTLALSVIIDAIAGSNEAPFKKAMLESGICEDVSFTNFDGILQNSLMLEIKNVKEERLGEAKELVLSTVRDIVEGGIDKKALGAAFNAIEFRMREQDSGTTPRGLLFALATLDSWLYGGDPTDPLTFEDELRCLREALSTDYYERLLEKTVLLSEHSATLTMLPSAVLGKERLEEERRRLAGIKASMSEDEINEVIRKTRELEAWQMTTDSKEALDTLPRLKISDIEKEPTPYPNEEYTLSDTTVLYTPVASRGITYLSLLFDLSDFSEDELFYASLLTDMLKNLPTARRSASDIQTLVKTELGSFSASVAVFSKNRAVTPYMRISMSVLDTNFPQCRELAREILLETLFDKTDAIGKIVKQIRIGAQEMMAASGNSVALARSAAYVDKENAVSEYVDGLEFYLRIKALDADFENCAKASADALRAAYEKIFSKKRLSVFYSGKRSDENIKELIELLPEGSAVLHASRIEPLGKRCEGILIPAAVSFAANAVNCLDYLDHINGSFGVIRTILSYEFLWNRIRVQGGAYGAGFTRRAGGIIGYYTYRDPNADRSLGVFAEAGDFLREFASSGESLEGYIIGALGDSDPLITPKVLSVLSMSSYLRGETFLDRVRYRKELLETSPEDLIRLCDVIDKITQDGAPVVVGGRDKLDACIDKIKTVIEL